MAVVSIGALAVDYRKNLAPALGAAQKLPHSVLGNVVGNAAAIKKGKGKFFAVSGGH